MMYQNGIGMLFTLLFASMALLVSERGAVAEESGSFRSVSSTDFELNSIEFAGEQVTVAVFNGTSTVVDSTGGPFAIGSNSIATCIAYSRTSAEGLDLDSTCKTWNESGDELYFRGKRTAGDFEEGGGGRFQIIGGTGGNSGLAGSCTYETEYLTNGKNVSLLDCEWTRP